MRADILCNQELEGSGTDEVITEDYGKTQFTNGKQLHSLLADYKKKNEEKEQN